VQRIIFFKYDVYFKYVSNINQSGLSVCAKLQLLKKELK